MQAIAQQTYWPSIFYEEDSTKSKRKNTESKRVCENERKKNERRIDTQINLILSENGNLKDSILYSH